MRFSKIHCLVCAALTVAVAGPAWGVSEPEELLDLRTKFNNALDHATDSMRTFWTSYQRSLTELRTKAQAAGDLEGVLAVEAEIKKAEQRSISQDSAYGPLKALEKSFNESYQKQLRQAQPERTRLYGIYIAALQDLETSLTKQSRLDEALLVRNAELAARKEVGGAASKTPADSAPTSAVASGAKADAATPGQLGTTTIVGHVGGGSEYRDVAKDGAVLIGFNIIITPFKDSNDTVRGVMPIYLGKTGESKGSTYGAGKGSSTRRVTAKPGYAVGAITIQYSGLSIRRMKLRFDRIDGKRLDTKDSYESPWVGVYNDAKEEKVDLEGKLPVGIAGSSGLGLDCIGLVFLQP
jgi:hypothetical protein